VLKSLSFTHRAVRYLGRRYIAATDPHNPYRDLDRFLVWWTVFHPREWRLVGHISPWQAQEMYKVIEANKCRYIAEIGFNAGHSALAILRRFDDLRLVSFDLDEHRYTRPAAAWINRRFSNQHRLIIGDSAVTVPEYAKAHPAERFDLIIVDGDHTERGALADIVNGQLLCRPGATIIMDDVGVNGHNDGPERAWQQAIADGLVEEIAWHEAAGGHAFAVGRYLQAANVR
jgi:predicted O-methyltransferase YrrM